MSVFTHRYQKTGLVFALALSFIYLPLLIGVLDENKFIQNYTCNLIVFISFSITFFTTINYKIILSMKIKTSNPIIRFFIAPINFIIMFLIYLFLPFEIEKDIFIFGLVFLSVPWIFFFLKIMKKHCTSLKFYNLRYKNKII